MDEYEIGLVGDAEALGSWNVSHCLRLKPQHEHGRLALRHYFTSDLMPNLLLHPVSHCLRLKPQHVQCTSYSARRFFFSDFFHFFLAGPQRDGAAVSRRGSTLQVRATTRAAVGGA
jgi:hypothetical protein